MKRKVVLITGCSSGIGKALAKEFHRCGFCVIATARKLDSLIELQKKGISTYSLDVNNEDEINKVISSVLEKEEHIDILVNNAGYGLMGPSIEIPKNDFIMQFQTNVISPVVIAQKVVPGMKERGKGLIINIGSISGIVTTPFSGAYCASKAALHALSDALRMELAPFGIRVISVQPGAIASNFGETANTLYSGIFKKNSWYHSLENSIRKRAKSSQIDATSAENFAGKLVSISMKENSPSIVRIGKKSFYIPLLKKLFPISVLDNILKNKFELTKIKEKSI
ncbi:SDR family oxidoreductase [Desulfocicer niacini]